MSYHMADDDLPEIDCDGTEEIVCPFCGYVHGDSWKFRSNQQEDLGLYDCANCEKEFYVNREVRVTYSTMKAEYGTCKHCNETDVVIESKKGYPFPNYSGLCLACGKKEEDKQFEEHCATLEAEYIISKAEEQLKCSQ